MAGPCWGSHQEDRLWPTGDRYEQTKRYGSPDVNAASKEGTLLYFQFCHLLIEHYSNILYVSDALNTYAHLMQGENKFITQ